jgi:ribosomal protein S18 acetylase RimI-like enzyme
MHEANWRRIEEATLNAWPSLQTLLLDGWVLRMAAGHTKRANSVNVLHGSTQPLASKIALCEQRYAAAGLPCIFRLTSAGPDQQLDQLLADRGYVAFDQSLVLTCELASAGPWAASGQITAGRLPEWLDAYMQLSGASPASRAAHSGIRECIRLPALLGQREAGGRTVACGLAVCDAEQAGIFDIIVDPGQRRQGHARALIEELFAWACAMGARQGYIQVLEQNHAAQALYRSLGFRQAYRYWYRMPAASRAGLGATPGREAEVER